MKTRMTSTISACLTMMCLIATVLPTDAEAAERTVRLTNGEWQPYMSEHIPHYGMGSHLVTDAFKMVDVAVEYGFFPWKRAYTISKNGKWEGSVGWAYNEDRAAAFYYSDPVFPSSNAFFHLKGSAFDWETMDDMKDIKIGATLEYIYGDEFAAAANSKLINPEYVASDELNLKKLLNGRIDVFVGNVLVTYAQIRDTFSEQEALEFTHHRKVLSSIDLHLILTRANPDSKQLIDVFNDGLRQLRDSGRYEKIITDALTGKYEKAR